MELHKDQLILEGISMHEFFKTQGIFPFSYAGGEVLPEALDLYFSWLNHYNIKFNKDLLPWVPVGLVGCCIVVGHYDPSVCKQVFPCDVGQMVLLSERDYEQILKDLPSLVASNTTWTASSNIERIDKHFKIPQIADARGFIEYALDSMLLTSERRKEYMAIRDREVVETKDLPDDLLPCFWKFAYRQPLVDLRGLKVDVDTYDLIPEEYTKEFERLCFYRSDNVLFVASSEFQEKGLHHWFLNRLKGKVDRVCFISTTKKQIEVKQQQLARQKNLKNRTGESVVHANRGQEGLYAIDETAVASVKPNSKDCSSEGLFQWILVQAIAHDASDIHIEQWKGRGRIRFRIDGDLHIILEPGLDQTAALVNVAKIAFSMGTNTFDNEDSALSILLGEQKIGLRGNVIPFRNSFQKMVIRILPKADGVQRLDQLGLSENNISLLKQAISNRQGLIIISGPTGEGKTTTLYAALQEINTPELNIQTIEDPIEKELEGINQTAVDVKRDITFSSIMGSIVRQDPNVILLGEIRNRESAELALEAADTGHLVFATVHANSALKVVSRLKNLGIDAYKLGESLVLLQAQRLLKSLCPYCKEAEATSADQAKLFEKAGVEAPRSIYKAKGCSECNNSGYLGRVVVMELVPVNSDIAEAITKETPIFEMEKLTQVKGCRTLYQDALEKVCDGITSLEQARTMDRAWS